jgi:hypothetical protein
MVGEHPLGRVAEAILKPRDFVGGEISGQGGSHLGLLAVFLAAHFGAKISLAPV